MKPSELKDYTGQCVRVVFTDGDSAEGVLRCGADGTYFGVADGFWSDGEWKAVAETGFRAEDVSHVDVIEDDEKGRST